MQCATLTETASLTRYDQPQSPIGETAGGYCLVYGLAVEGPDEGSGCCTAIRSVKISRMRAAPETSTLPAVILVLLPLIGTIAGGALTMFAQWLARRADQAAVERAEVRSATRTAEQEERAVIREVTALVAGDIAHVRRAWDPVNADGTNGERLDATDAALHDLQARRIAAEGKMAQLLDDSVYECAQQVYDAWDRYFYALMQNITNETRREPAPEVTAAARGAVEVLRTKAQDRLRKLDPASRVG